MLIGLIGYKQSGKSTVTNHLIKQFDFKEILWAHKLKEVIGKQLFELDDEVLYGDSPKREEVIPLWNRSPRQILQEVGTDLFRNRFEQDFWVRVSLPKIERLLTKRNSVVISDCRFPNEVEAIKKFHGHTCRIVKTGQKSKDRHESETSLDDYPADFTLEAKPGDIDHLLQQANLMVTEIKGG